MIYVGKFFLVDCEKFVEDFHFFLSLNLKSLPHVNMFFDFPPIFSVHLLTIPSILNLAFCIMYITPSVSILGRPTKLKMFEYWFIFSFKSIFTIRTQYYSAYFLLCCILTFSLLSWTVTSKRANQKWVCGREFWVSFPTSLFFLNQRQAMNPPTVKINQILIFVHSY